MNDKPTLAQLNDDTTLRWAAGRILNPGPCAHRWEQMPLKAGFWCAKCHRDRASYEGYQDCPIPDPVTDPLEVVAEQLVRMCVKREGGDVRLCYAVYDYLKTTQHPKRGECSIGPWWFAFLASPVEKIKCCLLALNEVEVTP